MKIICLWPGQANLFINPSNDETVLEATFETYTDMFIRYVYKYIYIYIYLKTLYIDIKSSSYIHELYTSKCIHILLTMIYFRLPGPVYVFWLF